MKIRIVLAALTLATCLASPSDAQEPTKVDVSPVALAASPSIRMRVKPLSPLAKINFGDTPAADGYKRDWGSVLGLTAAGALFGGIAGGLHGGNRAQCNQCDTWGAFYGVVIGGFLGLGIGLIASTP